MLEKCLMRTILSEEPRYQIELIQLHQSLIPLHHFKWRTMISSLLAKSLHGGGNMSVRSTVWQSTAVSMLDCSHATWASSLTYLKSRATIVHTDVINCKSASSNKSSANQPWKYLLRHKMIFKRFLAARVVENIVHSSLVSQDPYLQLQLNVFSSTDISTIIQLRFRLTSSI